MSAFGLYKTGQGYWTRLGTAVGAGLLAAFGAMWLSGELSTLPVEDDRRVLIQGAVAGGVMLLAGFVVVWLVYLRRPSGDFLIATDGEMKKVNWSSRKEVMGSTWVVIAISVIIAAILLVTDVIFSAAGRTIGLLEDV